MSKRLNYHHLYYFWQVAKNGKLTDVAKELHVSQSALSAQIKQLEHQMDTLLFLRDGRRLSLTDTGKRVFGYAQDIFAKGKELELLLSQGIESDNHLSIGVMTNLSRNFVEAFIKPLMSNKDVSFSLHTRGLANLLKGLNKRDFDIVLTNCSIAEQQPEQNLQQHLVAQQPVAIIGHPDIKPVSDFPIGYEDVHWLLPNKGTAIRSAFEFFCMRNNYKPKIMAEVDDMAMLRLLTRDTDACAVMPPVVVKDEINNQLLSVYQEIPEAFEPFYATTIDQAAFPKIFGELMNFEF
ncbi:LysR family transcriptional regulator [Planctobacterium marinum]|uniref:LysR family transcriptional regulator n=1 Tax=Planctobacterium marinum TaxID=1631968 RepID=A0AA48KQ76_9ALTE|nr:LysR family transcriptional regulator [Planctobacterium marinum]